MNDIATLLIVDDEENILKSLRRSLISNRLRILTATGGAEAVDVIRSQAVDMVISDYRMPGMNGLELMEWIRGRHPEIVRVMLSAYSDRGVILDAINRGEVFRFLTKPWGEEELQETVAQGLARRRESHGNSGVERRLQKSTLDTVMALAEAIELKDPYTKGHCSRVRDYALLIARRIGLSREWINHLIFGSILHDCGKIGIREEILLSSGRLGEEDRRTMERHSVFGFELTSRIDHLKTASLFIRQHHERWDGGGYPDGLVGEQSHICSRIISIADAYDAMTSNRPYRQAMPERKARRILAENRGTQFDARLVDAFLAALGQEGQPCLTEDAPRKKETLSTLLIVDDDPGVLSALKRCLMDENYRILTAGSGDAAMDVLQAQDAALIVSDQRMPGMSGVAFLTASRKVCPHAVRIMLSGRRFAEFDETMEQVNAAGIYKYVRKPWREDELKSVLRHALERNRMAVETAAGP